MTGASASGEGTGAWSTALFLVKALPAAWVVGMMVIGLTGRFQLAVDVQERQCLPGYRVFVIDRARHGDDLRRGDIVVYRADAQTPLEPRGAKLAKRVLGLPGDRVRVSAERTEVNGVVVGYGLLLAEQLGTPPAALEREVVVPAGHVWAMGATVDSYDSRYYGPVPLWKMQGKAWGVL
ncbi:Signal peptidase I (plasmid) [Rhodovastum atsumiense]|uniref:Signal peptidase I n=1 Tax=Rhodovastum atsumiense TaxID=504468 RepID=A0A5M6ILM3_9PROT|nr:signal peptidase I [Rhodovastum atsumiense]KAA5608515.1 signal peptidase I [Rhodovastum atsumiense]CAH2605793.1 Signal peptidase I [Rhodovastum atsumiense]